MSTSPTTWKKPRVAIGAAIAITAGLIVAGGIAPAQAEDPSIEAMPYYNGYVISNMSNYTLKLDREEIRQPYMNEWGDKPPAEIKPFETKYFEVKVLRDSEGVSDYTTVVYTNDAGAKLTLFADVTSNSNLFLDASSCESTIGTCAIAKSPGPKNQTLFRYLKE